MRIGVLVLAIAAGLAHASLLPPRFGAYVRGALSPVSIAPADRNLFAEYGLLATEHAAYTSAAGKILDAEVFHFRESEGAHAAYLWLRAGGAGSHATIVPWKNYVFLFRGAAPGTPALEQIEAALSDVDAAEPSPDLCDQGCDPLSERVLLGPASLARFAPDIPPSLAPLRLGGRGQIARFNTPAGPMSLIVFEYPSTEAAQTASKELSRLPGAYVRSSGRNAGIIFNPPDPRAAANLMQDIGGHDSGATATIRWEPAVRRRTSWGGIAIVLAGFAIAVVIAVVLRLRSTRA